MAATATNKSTGVDLFETDRLAERVAARAFDRALTDVSPLITRAIRAERRATLALYASLAACAVTLGASFWLSSHDNGVVQANALQTGADSSRQQDEVTRQRERIEVLSREVVSLQNALQQRQLAPGTALVFEPPSVSVPTSATSASVEVTSALSTEK